MIQRPMPVTAGPQSVDGPHGRGGGLPGGLSRRRLDRLPEGRARRWRISGASATRSSPIPSTPLLAAYAAWKRIYAELADGFGANVRTKPDWSPVEKDMLAVIDLEKLLAIERATVEDGTR